MHLLVRETRSLDEEQGAVDLRQTPADLVFLSFSDADLGAVAMAWQGMDGAPSLRLANLARLRHPMSVDLYVEQVIAHARCVVVRLLGGFDYWPYGVQEVHAACRHRGIALAIVPGDVRDDPRLTEFSTAPADIVAAFDLYFRHGGPANLRHALQLAALIAGLGAAPQRPPEILPSAGEYFRSGDTGTDAVIVFYRSHLLAGDVAPIDALAAALQERGIDTRALYVSSLKDPVAAEFVAKRLRAWKPKVVVSATAFAASESGAGSPLDAAGVPVLQVVLAGNDRDAWRQSSRGVSQNDMAMQIVLPELDGRLLTTSISFKSQTAMLPGLDFSRVINMPDPEGIALAADRVLGWARLSSTPSADRRIAIVLSDYPGAGGGQIGHAVGLDSFASLSAILHDLAEAGYGTGPIPDSSCLTELLCETPSQPFMDLATYIRLSKALPAAMRDALVSAWGDPAADPSVRDGMFELRIAECGNVTLAVQPDRGNAPDRKAGYHDSNAPSRHGFVAFYLWLREIVGLHAMIHLGAHGTLEWLPGKACALSGDCMPAALLRGLPVIYPFIVNNPGEAAAAKRRLGAVTISHLTPPLRAAGTHGAALELERLIDEYAAADGLDRRRTSALRREIRERAGSTGLLAESGVPADASDDEALAQLDAYLCDVKELQIRDGLHVFGRADPPARHAMLRDALIRTSPDTSHAMIDDRLNASAPAERTALLAALDGNFVRPGPAGAPTRGRLDVLPTGRNLFTIDPRAIPSRSAVMLAERAAQELLRRHLQDRGEWPRSLVIDLWGSTTIRTGGEDFALALVLLGAKPVWDADSSRVSGVEILPLAVLDRPRIDVTLRISGLFRDAFEAQIALFNSAVGAVAARDEAPDWNPLVLADESATRIFGPAPGQYGAGVSEMLAHDRKCSRQQLGDAYLAASSYGFGRAPTMDGQAFAARIAGADAFIHQQDHAEADLLEGTEYAAHEGGFAAAAECLGAVPAMYHLDTSHPDHPRTRSAAEEVARIVRGRAANPQWIAGMMRHGYRGAAEMARALDGLHGFAVTLGHRFDAQFDLMFDSTLGDQAVDKFLESANPQARHGMAERFRDALRRDLWRPRRNSPADMLLG